MHPASRWRATAARRAAAPLLPSAGRAAFDPCLLAAGPTAANPQQQQQQQPDGTDGLTTDRCI